MQAVLDSHASLDPKPVETLTPDEARKQPTVADAVKALLRKQGKKADPKPVAKVKDTTIPGPAGDIPARVYTPAGAGPFPVVVYWHGGGFVFADVDVYDSSARALCNAAGAVVVSCHYRQAPEHPFPAAPDDAFAAYQHVVKNAAGMGGNPKAIAVAGESAGGNLAALVCVRARDAGVQMPVHQLLVYPAVDWATEQPSVVQYADAKPLNRAMLKWFGKHYFKDPKQAADPKASPTFTLSLAKLPPATIITADIDPLRDQGKIYADKLKAAGVPVAYTNFSGVTHEFFGTGAVVDEAKRAVAVGAAGLKAGFAAGK